MGQLGGIALRRDSDHPLYLQLADGISARIASGDLEPGERLPPSRELAARLGVNRNTVSNAYEELVRTGRLRSRVGQGTFVAERKESTAGIRFTFSRATDAARPRVRTPVPDSDHPDPIDFASLVPDEGLFPVEPFRRALDDALAREGRKLLQYGPTAGHPPLRGYIAERLRRRGVNAGAEDVLIVNGSQQALDLVCRALVDPGDRVAIESPTYTIVLPLLAQYHARIDEIPMTPTGLDLEALEASLQRAVPKLLFTMPTFQNPTGITMDLPSRRRLLELAARYRVPVVEDDFDSELRFDGEAVPPLKALDEAGLVLHIGTFSKGLFPGLRLGWVVGPPEVIEVLGRSKLISDYHTSLLLQAAVLAFCNRGAYEKHLERLTGIYREKSRALTLAFRRHFPESVSWTRPEGGYAFWVSLPEGLSGEDLAREGARAGVLFTPGEPFFPRGGGERFLRLSISRVPLERIEEGVSRLGAILREHIGRRDDRAKSGEAGTERHRHEPAVHI